MLKMPRLFQVLLLLGSILLSTTIGFAQKAVEGKRISVGIMPVFDASGEVHGEIFSQNLTYMLFNELQGSSGIEAVLMNPGGVYSPYEAEWIQDYSAAMKVDVALVTTVQSTNKPRHGDWQIKVEGYLVDVRSGNKAPVSISLASIRRQELGVEVAYVSMWGLEGSRPFEKQELGKVARRIAQSLKSYTQASAPGLVPDGTGQSTISNNGTCKVMFEVKYMTKSSNSMSYSLIVNKKEESLWIRDGIANVNSKSGPIIVQVSTTDAPYRLPIQRMYQASTQLDCLRGDQHLALEIGAAGEAFLRWK